jgi:hypothetical protein
LTELQLTELYLTELRLDGCVVEGVDLVRSELQGGGGEQLDRWQGICDED